MAVTWPLHGARLREPSAQGGELPSLVERVAQQVVVAAAHAAGERGEVGEVVRRRVHAPFEDVSAGEECEREEGGGPRGAGRVVPSADGGEASEKDVGCAAATRRLSGGHEAVAWRSYEGLPRGECQRPMSSRTERGLRQRVTVHLRGRREARPVGPR